MSIPAWDERWRGAAHRLVDQLFDHVEGVASRPVVAWTSPQQLSADEAFAIGEPGPDNLERLVAALADASIQLHHPRYAGHQVCPPFAIGAIAEMAIATLNNSTAVWEMSPASTIVEKNVIRWLCDQVGYPASAGGTTVSGGSAANLTALLAARHRWTADGTNVGKTPVVICSETAHYSIARAAAILGSGIRVAQVPVDDQFRMRTDELDHLLAAMEGTDESPMAIVATSGSTATGSFDALGPIADLRDRHRTWLHVDAAHGASTLLSARLRRLVEGLARADSLSWDPHKMMWMPLSTSAVLVKDEAWLRAAFLSDAPYLFHRDREGLDLGAMTIQCSRRADAVKLWLALNTIGPEPIAEAMEGVAERACEFAGILAADPEFEAMHDPQFNIVCFRYRRAGSKDDEALDSLNATLRQGLLESGDGWITTTKLRGRRCLRVTIINPATTRADLEAILGKLRSLAKEIG
ncbi:MAG TPA: pyridoxal-dependent decarboxylase [Thermoanaerobaculia bacterium]|nr:pyridoxal-dependent decarboxylase [Thermoanaerobaculia bacterium]